MIDRKRPYPLAYRRRVLRLAAMFDRWATRLRVHVLTHTPRRTRVL